MTYQEKYVPRQCCYEAREAFFFSRNVNETVDDRLAERAYGVVSFVKEAFFLVHEHTEQCLHYYACVFGDRLLDFLASAANSARSAERTVPDYYTTASCCARTAAI